MVFIAILIGCIVGALIGINAPMISYTYSSYLAIAVVAALDSVFGGITSVINKKFDLIFLDPPYKTNCIEESIKLIDEYNLLNDNGIIVCESDNLDKIVYTDKFSAIKDRHYGDKYIVLLKKI